MVLVLALLGLAALHPAFAQEEAVQLEGPNPLPIPRFVTLATDEVNVRSGPGIRYPIRTIIRKQGLPVEIIREFDVWRQVRDREGEDGWVHKSMLSGKRAVIVTGEIEPLLRKPEAEARAVARLEPGVIAALETCKGEWCEIEVGGYGGWMTREKIWGVYPEESFKE